MGPKKGKKKNKVVMTLADFNPEASVGTPQELKDLPSAPKQAEEWEAVGGRPEYNSKGFKERTVTHDYDDNALLESDEAFMQRDWTRGANFNPDDESGGGAGAGGVERSWDGMRRSGPLDGPDGDGAERDFGAARGGMGPVDSSFDAGGPERDFGAARRGAGAVDASFDAGGGPDRDFGAARGSGAFDAEFDNKGGDIDFGAARGSAAFDAEFDSKGGDVDFGGARRGSAAFDAEFEGSGRDVDFAKRTGPTEAEFSESKHVDFGTARGSAAFDAEFSGTAKEIDFSSKRSGPVEAEFSNRQKHVDFGSVRGGSGAFDAEFAGRNIGGGERDMNNMRGGSKASEMARPNGSNDLNFGDVRKGTVSTGRVISSEGGAGVSNGMTWGARKGPIDASSSGRRDGARDFGSTRQPVSGNPSGSSDASAKSISNVKVFTESGRASGSSDSALPVKERDWGQARRTQRLPGEGRDGTSGSVDKERAGYSVTRGLERTRISDESRSTSPPNSGTKGDGSDEEWTTVRSSLRSSRGGGGAPPRSRGSANSRSARLVPVGESTLSQGSVSAPNGL